jgi:GDP-4-dehydro-6-deoxy-D-mannose reductase
MSHILVTGATGFIGKHLVPQLHNAGHTVVAVNSKSGDIEKKSTWDSFPKVDMVIHLAGKSFVPASWVNPGSFITCNLEGTLGALNYCREYSAGLIFLSSYLYGNPILLPIPETSPLEANNPYALSKKLAEDICKFYTKSYGINVTIFRPFNVYGPGQPSDFLIPSIIRQVNNSEVVTVNDLDPKRDYVYVDDLVRAIVKVLDSKQNCDIFNIGSGVSYSVKELIGIIQEIKGTNLPIISAQHRRKDEVMDTIADISLVKEKLDWSPKWSLKEGLKKILDNY